MSMNGILVAVSPARRAALASGDALRQLLVSRWTQRIPGLLDLAKDWDLLDRTLRSAGDPVLGDAILARTGAKFGPNLGYGPARLLEDDRCRVVAAALVRLPADLVDRALPSLVGHDLYALPDTELSPPERKERREQLVAQVEAVTQFYGGAADRGDAVLALLC